MYVLFSLLVPNAIAGVWEDPGTSSYWGNDDYACSGNNHPVEYGSFYDFLGESCTDGESISVAVYAKQGWDCDFINLYRDLQCVSEPVEGVWESVSGTRYWGNDDYACSGNNYPVYYSSYSIDGEDCDEVGTLVSVPVYSRQGWDCDDVALFEDFECVE